MICMTLDCVGLTQSSVIWIICCNVGLKFFYARKQLLLSARLSHRNSVCPSVCLSVCYTGGSVKNGL